MKTILIVLLINLSLSTQAGAWVSYYKMPDKEKWDLKGPVHSVLIEVEHPTGRPIGDVYVRRTPLRGNVFDEKGNIIELTVYYPDGTPDPSFKTVITYDDEGRVKESIGVHPSSEKRPNNGVSRVYNVKGDVTEEHIFRGDKSTPSNINIYNTKGYLIEERMYYDNGSLVSTTTYQYDENGRMVESAKYDAYRGHYKGGTKTESWAYTYSLDGKEKRAERFGIDGKNLGKFISRYDSNGNETEWVSYAADGLMEYKTIRSYEYDTQGNWIKETTRTIYSDKSKNEDLRITYRTITYYPSK